MFMTPLPAQFADGGAVRKAASGPGDLFDMISADTQLTILSDPATATDEIAKAGKALSRTEQRLLKLKKQAATGYKALAMSTALSEDDAESIRPDLDDIAKCVDYDETDTLLGFYGLRKAVAEPRDATMSPKHALDLLAYKRGRIAQDLITVAKATNILFEPDQVDLARVRECQTQSLIDLVADQKAHLVVLRSTHQCEEVTGRMEKCQREIERRAERIGELSEKHSDLLEGGKSISASAAHAEMLVVKSQADDLLEIGKELADQQTIAVGQLRANGEAYKEAMTAKRDTMSAMQDAEIRFMNWAMEG